MVTNEVAGLFSLEVQRVAFICSLWKSKGCLHRSLVGLWMHARLVCPTPRQCNTFHFSLHSSPIRRFLRRDELSPRNSVVAQWERAGLIILRSMVRTHSTLRLPSFLLLPVACCCCDPWSRPLRKTNVRPLRDGG